MFGDRGDDKLAVHRVENPELTMRGLIVRVAVVLLTIALFVLVMNDK